MSRAYRIAVRESETRRVSGSDEVCTDLELLEILPGEQMADLLRQELAGKGFAEADDGTMSRVDGPVTITVDPCNGQIAVRSVVAENVKLEAKTEATGYDDGAPEEVVRERARASLRDTIEKKADAAAERAQAQASAALEAKLADLKPEIDQVVNRVTRAALKQKAAQLGSIKSVTEDDATGELTLTVEV
jgi:hypothetical protein